MPLAWYRTRPYRAPVADRAQRMRRAVLGHGLHALGARIETGDVAHAVVAMRSQHGERVAVSPVVQRPGGVFSDGEGGR